MDPPRQPTSSTEPTQTQPVRLDYISATTGAGVLCQREPGRLLIHLPPPPIWALLAPRVVALLFLTLLIAGVIVVISPVLRWGDDHFAIAIGIIGFLAAVAWAITFHQALNFGRFGRMPVAILVEDDALHVNHLTPGGFSRRTWRRGDIADLSAEHDRFRAQSDILYLTIRSPRGEIVILTLLTRAKQIDRPLERDLRRALGLNRQP